MTVLLDIDQLRTFIAIAETGSFTRAADIVFKTQSAVSMQMKRLEERIGKPIFERDGRSSRLTEDVVTAFEACGCHQRRADPGECVLPVAQRLADVTPLAE